jgi:hypothetical protein
MPDAAGFATIDKPTLLVAASESPPEQREMTDAMAGVLDARTALLAGGHLIDPAAPEVLAFIEEVTRKALAALVMPPAPSPAGTVACHALARREQACPFACLGRPSRTTP